MKKPIFSLIVMGFLFTYVNCGLATTQRIKPDYDRNRMDFEDISKTRPGSILFTGEIIGINQAEIVLKLLTADNTVCRFRLNPNTKFFCNGISSQWETLKPVAPGAYFEAQVLVDGQMEALAVNGFYYGEECIVKKCYRNQGKLVMELISVISWENFTYGVNERARLPQDEDWKEEGQVVYVLYNGTREIRAVFLPD